jgi:hypothetical protein
MSNQIEDDEIEQLAETLSQHPDSCMCEPCKTDRQQRLNRVMKGPDDPPEDDTVRPTHKGITERDAHVRRVRLIRESITERDARAE